jgi:Ca2+-binding RTX toxin-like protein
MKNVKKPALLLLATMVTVSVLAGGVALAATVNCTANTVCVGTSGEDRIRGAADATGGEDMSGLGGGDVLRGYAGFDFLNGGAGVDLLSGGADGDSYVFDGAWGTDTVADLSGFDSLDFSFIRGEPVEVDLGPNSGGPAARSGTARVYISSGSVIEQALGGLRDDTIRGNAADNSLEGSEGNDEVAGGGGADGLGGGRGDDTLTGGPGQDIIVSRSGNDTIHAADGEADDISCGTGADTIYFDPGVDVLASNCET